MRERSPGVWELIVEAGRDPVTGKRRQISRVFRGSVREAKKARAELLTDVGRGRHNGTKTTVDDLFHEWVQELERKGRSPNTIHNYVKVYHHDIAHQRRGLKPRTVYQIHATMSSMLRFLACWVVHGPDGLVVIPARYTTRVSTSIKNST